MGEGAQTAEQGRKLDNLEALLDEVREAAESGEGTVVLGDLLDRIGTRSFGPLLLLPALIAFTPLGGIPGLPTVMAVLVILVVGQLAIGLDHFWLPDVVLRRGVEPTKLRTSTEYLRRPGRHPRHDRLRFLARRRMGGLPDAAMRPRLRPALGNVPAERPLSFKIAARMPGGGKTWRKRWRTSCWSGCRPGASSAFTATAVTASAAS
jgi:hypothetical protein